MQSHYYQTKTGTLHYIRKNGRGPLIVAIHGVGANHTVWNKVLEDLENSYLLIDLHGHGQSSAEWMDVDTAVADIALLLKRESIKNFVLVGNSLGASIAIRLSHVVKPQKLILISPYLRELLRYTCFQLLWLHVWRWIPARLPRRHIDYSTHIGRRELVYPFLDLHRISTAVWSKAALSAMRVGLDEISQNIPLCVIIGKQDRFTRQDVLDTALPWARKHEIQCNHVLICSKPHEIGEIIKREI
ncbi:alpha/beta hydrolase [Candidatus Woesearchaeota archaeon]|nr:alpha/beta hydrolase [Candidatus Woesearchaeota archaeon]